MSRSLSARAGGITMTEGSLYKNIFLFSVPLIFSQLLQVLFNMADVAVVGKFSSATALGSVGSTSTLVTLFTGFLIGLSNGVNVRVAQYLGAQQEEDTRNCVHTSLILCTLSGLVIAVLCFFLAAPMLELLKTKDDLLPGAVLYFRIYALGMPALGIFNFGNAVSERQRRYEAAAGLSDGGGHSERDPQPVLRHRLQDGGRRRRAGKRDLAVSVGCADPHPYGAAAGQLPRGMESACGCTGAKPGAFSGSASRRASSI